MTHVVYPLGPSNLVYMYADYENIWKQSSGSIKSLSKGYIHLQKLTKEQNADNSKLFSKFQDSCKLL